MKTSRTIVLTIAACLSATWATAQEPETPDANDQEAVHQELRALRQALTEAVLAGDIEAQLQHVHPNVVATWQNHQVVRGEEGLREFLADVAANGGVFQGYTEPPTADELTILYGDGEMGVVFGTSVPHYRYLGMEFDLENRWTATLVRQDGQWKIAAYHVSANVLDNPLLDVAKRSIWWAGGVALVAGLVIGSGGTLLVRRLRKA